MKMDGFGAAQIRQCFAVLALHLHLNLGLHDTLQLEEHYTHLHVTTVPVLSELCNSPHTI